jgi:hypothetical protein
VLDRRTHVSRIREIVRRRWDELGIAAVLGDFYTSGDIDAENSYVLTALRRSRSDLSGATREQLRDYLRSLDDDQLPGLVNNVKGIAHEVWYVEAENADGDSVAAYMFEETNHPDYDVVLVDEATGDELELQLKATDSAEYVTDAVDELGAERVVVTEELADELGLESTGISNEQLTTDVEHLVDVMVDSPDLWDYVPALSAWSLALLVVSLTRRYRRKEIDAQQYRRMLTKFGGLRVLKMVLITAALSVPGLNIAVGAALFLTTVRTVIDVYRT